MCQLKLSTNGPKTRLKRRKNENRKLDLNIDQRLYYLLIYYCFRLKHLKFSVQSLEKSVFIESCASCSKLTHKPWKKISNRIAHKDV